MSRIGNRVLTLKEGVSAEIENNTITVKGPKGSLNFPISKSVIVKMDGNTLTVEKADESASANAMQGTTNAIIKNMIEGVTNGFEKGLEIIGVGYRFQVQGKLLTVNAGYSPVKITIPEGLTVDAISNTEIVVKGIDKELVGEFAANVRKVRKPEPYKGKGIRYKGEVIRRKEGKKAAK